MASEARVNDNLFLMFRFREFNQEDLRGEVVDIGDAEGDEGNGELVGDDLGQLGR